MREHCAPVQIIEYAVKGYSNDVQAKERSHKQVSHDDPQNEIDPKALLNGKIEH